MSTVSHRPLKPKETAVGAHLTGRLMAFRAGPVAAEKTSFWQQSGIEPPLLGRATLSQLLC